MKKGFTLVEVAIASALLAITLGGLLTAIMTARRSALVAGSRLAAMQVARRQMEQLLTYPFFAAPQLTFSPPPHPIAPATQLIYGANSVSTGVFYGAYVVTNDSQFSAALVKNINLTVYWTNAGTRWSSSVNLNGSLSSTLHP